MKKLIYSHGESSGIGPDLVITLCKTNYWAKLKYPFIVVGDDNASSYVGGGNITAVGTITIAAALS